MEVRLLDDCVVRDEVWRAGDVLTLADDDAKLLIERGKAEPAPVTIVVDSVEQVLGCVFT